MTDTPLSPAQFEQALRAKGAYYHIHHPYHVAMYQGRAICSFLLNNRGQLEIPAEKKTSECEDSRSIPRAVPAFCIPPTL